MLSFIEFITEAQQLKLKGWVHKSGKFVLWKYDNNLQPYHAQHVASNPKKYGLTKEKILKLLSEFWNDPDTGVPGVPDDKTEEIFQSIAWGEIDSSEDIDRYLEKKGWVQVYKEPEGQISASTRGALSKSDIHKVSIGLEKAFKISSSKFYPAQSPRTCVRSHARSWRPMVELEHGNGSIRIEDKRTWIDYLKTGKIIKAPQSKLAQFR